MISVELQRKSQLTRLILIQGTSGVTMLLDLLDVMKSTLRSKASIDFHYDKMVQSLKERDSELS
jgi:hypothetical protein